MRDVAPPTAPAWPLPEQGSLSPLSRFSSSCAWSTRSRPEPGLAAESSRRAAAGAPAPEPPREQPREERVLRIVLALEKKARDAVLDGPSHLLADGEGDVFVLVLACEVPRLDDLGEVEVEPLGPWQRGRAEAARERRDQLVARRKPPQDRPEGRREQVVGGLGGSPLGRRDRDRQGRDRRGRLGATRVPTPRSDPARGFRGLRSAGARRRAGARSPCPRRSARRRRERHAICEPCKAMTKPRRSRGRP
jgi:hypothetical protein